MKRLIFFTYLTLSVLMSSLFTVTACGKNIDNISDFLLGHKSGKFKEYAELIKKQNNLNAEDSR